MFILMSDRAPACYCDRNLQKSVRGRDAKYLIPITGYDRYQKMLF